MVEDYIRHPRKDMLPISNTKSVYGEDCEYNGKLHHTSSTTNQGLNKQSLYITAETCTLALVGCQTLTVMNIVRVRKWVRLV